MDTPMTTFSNWAGSVTTKPQEFVQPSRIDEIPGIISRARSVRAVGAGHSFTPIAAGEETMLNLDHVSGLVSVDKRQPSDRARKARVIDAGAVGRGGNRAR